MRPWPKVLVLNGKVVLGAVAERRERDDAFLGESRIIGLEDVGHDALHERRVPVEVSIVVRIEIIGVARSAIQRAG